MHEKKEGKLKTGSDKIATSCNQAVAIGFSEVPSYGKAAAKKRTVKRSTTNKCTTKKSAGTRSNSAKSSAKKRKAEL